MGRRGKGEKGKEVFLGRRNEPTRLLLYAQLFVALALLVQLPGGFRANGGAGAGSVADGDHTTASVAAPADRARPDDLARMKAFAAGRRGYIVWESRRPSGTRELKYRIWKRNLDGSGLAMISGQGDRAAYSHMGPRISPDGRRVIFAGRRWNLDSKDPGPGLLYGGAYAAPPYDAWIIDLDPETLEAREPRELRSLRGQVGTAGQDRFFEWKDNRTVYVNVPSQRGFFEVDVIDDRVGEKVVVDVAGERLLSADGETAFCAAGGGARYSRIDRTGPAPRLGPEIQLPGCQVIVSSLGEFLLWMQQSGRVGVLDLARNRTPQLGPVPGRTLPLHAAIQAAYPPYHHCYFPAISRDRTIVVCGASRFPPGIGADEEYKRWLRQDHKGADYEIFAFHFDPQTLDPVGPPVRYSYNEHRDYPEVLASSDLDSAVRLGHALDRWPDVWAEDAEFERRHAATESAPHDAAAVRLARAHKLETIDPRAALELYRTIQQETDDLELGTRNSELPPSASARAAGRRAELERDPAFQRELAAWDILQAMLRAESQIKPPPAGPRSFACNPELARANAEPMRAIQAGHAELVVRYPATRAMLEARALVARWEVPVPKEIPANQKVVAELAVVAERVSKPLTRRQAAPYTQAFMTMECRVTAVLSGGLNARRIIVVLMSMDDGKDLPPASYKTGGAYQLRLGLWADQTHFHSHKMADDIMDLDAAYYFAFVSSPLPPPSPAAPSAVANRE